MKWPTEVPEPALVRSVGVTATAVAAWWVGREVSTEWVDTVTTAYTLVAALVAGALIRPKVTPVSRLRQLGIELPAGGRHRRRELNE